MQHARVDLITSVSRERADRISELLRSAYASGDLMPGLPTADGALAEAAELYRDLDAGCPLWVAEDPTDSGRLLGTVRAVRITPDRWEVRRLAVDPAHRKAGAARALLRTLEAAARAAGAREVVLDAVVERGNPAFYARQGYRTVRHFGAADKLLSEVHMRRALDGPPVPVPHETSPEVPGLLLQWAAERGDPGRTVCRVRLLGRGQPTVAAGLGADFWPDAGPKEQRALERELRRHADSHRGAVLGFPCPATEIAAFCRPRQELHPELLAWWRSPAVGRLPRPR